MPVIRQRFVQVWFGWRVYTESLDEHGEEEGMGTEPAPFAFTWRGIRGKAARARRPMTRSKPRGIVEHYDENGRRVPGPRHAPRPEPDLELRL